MITIVKVNYIVLNRKNNPIGVVSSVNLKDNSFTFNGFDGKSLGTVTPAYFPYYSVISPEEFEG